MMKCNYNCISFILHINTCLYVHNAIDITLYYDRTYGGGRSSERVAVTSVVVRVYVKRKYGQRKALRWCQDERFERFETIGWSGWSGWSGGYGWIRLYSLIRHVKLQSANFVTSYIIRLATLSYSQLTY